MTSGSGAGYGDSPDPRARHAPTGYRSSVCSIPDAALGSLARAIDELAADSHDGATPAQVAERIARIWGMVTDLDPELARRRSGYEETADG
jgi:hypothetical protein